MIKWREGGSRERGERKAAGRGGGERGGGGGGREREGGGKGGVREGREREHKHIQCSIFMQFTLIL